MTSVRKSQPITSLGQLIRSALDTIDALDNDQISYNKANAKFNGIGRALKGIEINQKYGAKTPEGFNDIKLA